MDRNEFSTSVGRGSRNNSRRVVKRMRFRSKGIFKMRREGGISRNRNCFPHHPKMKKGEKALYRGKKSARDKVQNTLIPCRCRDRTLQKEENGNPATRETEEIAPRFRKKRDYKEFELKRGRRHLPRGGRKRKRN